MNDFSQSCNPKIGSPMSHFHPMNHGHWHVDEIDLTILCFLCMQTIMTKKKNLVDMFIIVDIIYICESVCVYYGFRMAFSEEIVS